MSQYRAYPTYKNSGVEWIGQVPEHWEVKPFKYILSAPMSYGANESAESDDPNHPRYIRITDLTENGTLREDTFKTLPWDKAYSYLLSDGDILLARSGATVGKSFLYRETNGAACFAGYLIKASCNEEKALPKYIYAYLQSHSYWEYISGSNIQSTIQNVSAEKYSSMVLPVPPPEEQAAIAAILDRETAHIDALIEKKTRFIELLKEKRQALITHAVTKGLDPNAKMKDSGIEWIGQVPEHWEVKPFFALVTELNRKNVGLVETNILSLSYGNIIQKPETRNMGLTPESYETYQIVESGEIVFRFTDLQNDKRSLRSAQVTQRGIITSAYMAVKPHSIDSTYFAWLMRSYDLCKVFYAMGGGLRQSLKFEDVRRLPVLIPPVDEQSEITNTINAGTARIDALVAKTEQSVILLKEHRAAFITAAVSGQIDLRGK